LKNPSISPFPATNLLSSGLSTAATVGVGVGGLAVGALAGMAAIFFFYRHRRNQARKGLSSPSYVPALSSPSQDPWGSSASHRPEPSNASATMSTHLSGNERYHIEPFVLPHVDSSGSDYRRSEPRTPTSPDEDRMQQFPTSSKRSRSPGRSVRPRDSDHSLRRTSHSNAPGGQVYVVHHDGGRAPVTVYHQDGTEVVELPPRYLEGVASGSSTADRDTNSDWDSHRPLI
jgi:hypothetical protein